MTIGRIILAFAGIVILISVILAYMTGNQLWLLLSGFVGLNLLPSAFTGFCPLALILKKLGKQSGAAF